MTLEKQIEILKEWHKEAKKEIASLPILFADDIERFLHWLEDYKQLKDDYAELDNKLRTANTEIDRLQSVSSWIPCSERMPEPGDIVLVYAHVSVSDEEYWDEQFTAISVPKKMYHAFKGEEGTCWIGASNLHRLGDMISAETGFHFRGSEYVDTMRITHWMPLPKQPQRKDDTHDND